LKNYTFCIAITSTNCRRLTPNIVKIPKRI
jgi:hypothetical protein